MLRVGFTLTLALSLAAPSLTAQTSTRVPSGGEEIVLTIHAPAAGGDRADASPVTVLLVPGWGGGPGDALGAAAALAREGIGVVVLSPRGWHESGGTGGFRNALEDIGAALAWVRDPANASAWGLDPGHVILGGHSFGGGMSLAYAAGDPSVERVFSFAGTDHAQLIRQYRSDPAFREMLEAALTSSAAPAGPIRFDATAALRELEEEQAALGLRENAARLADRSIIIFGGWEDRRTTVDRTLLPFYRLLREAGADDVTFITYHTNHGFTGVRERLHHDLLEWIRR